MEMMCWGTPADSRAIAELLGRHLDDEVAIDPRTRALWQSNGLRIVAVPVEALDALRQLLPQSGGVQRQWLGQVSEWTDVVQGTPWHDLQPVDMDNGRLTLGPGRIRMLIRCWTMPVPAPEASGEIRSAMRAELLLQHQEPPRPDTSALYSRPTDVTNPLEQGLAFQRLAATLTLPPDVAVLIIPEAPQVDWRAMAKVPADQMAPEPAALAETRSPPEDDVVGVGQVLRGRALEREREQPAEPPEIDPAGPVDPNVDFARTLGELLLTPGRARLQSGVGSKPPIRSILVLAPRIPERYSITPAPAGK